uniref:Phosphoribosyltransferase domain-containing protein n=1 Tax=Chlamydomonas leiostraca TaxID=1034604 RepID=A0A7S0WU72_9CHLO|mmetsp:Transcript_27768/g.70785  ORF Transcript_27768/g.70785 Transcript_27768/m.70785 type:complete len:349 (+) Transcript_27768:99-1145(+)
MSADPRGVSKITKHYWSWEQIHDSVLKSVDELQEKFAPTLLVGVSGGGLIPSRMLRSGFKFKTGKTLPIQVVGAVHYDDDAGRVHDAVVRTQWLSPDFPLSGARVLLVDEVDDSRKTLAFLVADMLRYFEEAGAAYARSAKPGDAPWVTPQLAAFVIHNKVRPKEAAIDARVYPAHYFVAEHTPNLWHVYPWDAPDISQHTAIAHAQEHYFREKPAELHMAMAASSGMAPAAAVSAVTHYADGGSTQAPALAGGENGHGAANSGARSALTAALHNGGPDGAAQPQGIPKVGSGVWRSEPDGMYFNMGFIPNGLEPRFGSLTLVDAGSDRSMTAQLAREEAAAAAAGRQ